MNKLITSLAAVAAIAGMASAAPSIKALTADEQGRYGATHVINVDYSDLSAGTATNSAIAFTNTVTAPCSVKFALYQLDQAFDSKSNTNTCGVAVSVGTTTSTTKWISSVEAGYDATPTVYASYGTDYTVTTGATNAAATVTSPIVNAQTSTVSIVTTVTPYLTVAGSDMTKGHIRVFLRIYGRDYRN